MICMQANVVLDNKKGLISYQQSAVFLETAQKSRCDILVTYEPVQDEQDLIMMRSNDQLLKERIQRLMRRNDATPVSGVFVVKPELVQRLDINKDGIKPILISPSDTISNLRDACYELKVLGYTPVIFQPELNNKISLKKWHLIKHEGGALMISLLSLKFSLSRLSNVIRSWRMVLNGQADILVCHVGKASDYRHCKRVTFLLSLLKGKKYIRERMNNYPRKIFFT